ncbi:hypothetical protein CkaCkLH20_12091 [Colletotrichum karsti]|uniref:Polyketide synthase n=1 Tax=Colletotrichum karsti TaxID=1095194 RepID=A0A9P6HU91_9PEZI|nr:uncharacterized protein CkaCkLH20_12091 [Colletotrichum karsti]KAF9870424.1 hypothetical protein CkaCkLH20_12091 [Colletotrichum karsti]
MIKSAMASVLPEASGFSTSLDKMNSQIGTSEIFDTESNSSSQVEPKMDGQTSTPPLTESWSGAASEAGHQTPRPIAICGMALRLPNGIRDTDAFWEVLVNQKDLRGPVPDTRYNALAYTDKLGKRGAIKTQHGYFLDENLDTLDTSFFTMSRTELERCDPQQRQLLEVTREVLESAGEVNFRGKPIGCYVGTFGEDWLQLSAREQQHAGGYLMTGHGDLMLANRLSYEYDLKGPSMVLKTGCSASLIGLHEACRALQSGDCSGAIIAGANLIMGPTTTAAMTEEGMLSPEGSCKTFDAAADGYARGEAVNAIYIKLLDDAIRDNNPIRAVIRNSGTNSDGKSQNLLTPNSAAHEALMRKVYADIGLDPGKTAFVECHGTGTPTGDPLETNAVGNVFGSHGIYIGSVKPNVGHSEGASGLTSLIKGVLALEHNTIPPNIKFSNPNPKTTKASSTEPPVVMVFSGQGAQWPEMGKDLFHADQAFRDDIRKMDSILKSLIHPPSWTIEDEMLAPPETSRLHTAELAQPLCTALQIALLHRLRRAGICPVSVVGHSSGEIAAAYAAGVISIKEAIITAYYRGYITKSTSLGGGMAAVGLGVADVTPYIQGTASVVVACDNSPSSVTLSGDLDALDEVLSEIKKTKPDTLARKLKVDMAYHSHHMGPLSARYEDLLRKELAAHEDLSTAPSTTNIPMFSSVVRKQIISSRDVGPSYWVANLTSRVRFTDAILRILEDQPRCLFLEVGPHSTLGGPLRQTCSVSGTEYRYVSTLSRGCDSFRTALAALGQLYQHGIGIDWSAVVPSGRVLTNLPRYPWDHSSGSFWYEARVSRESRFRQFGHHKLLGLRVPESSDVEPLWRNQLSLVDEPWLSDHKIRSDVVFPFAGYISMAGEAIRQLTGVQGGYHLRDATVKSAMILTEQSVELITSLRPLKLTRTTDSVWYEFRVVSYNGSTWLKHCEGQIKASSDTPAPSQKPSPEQMIRNIPSSRWYDCMDSIGVVYGPEFQALSDIVSATTDNVAVAKVINESRHLDEAFHLHPVAIDACLQLLLVAMVKGIGRKFGQLRVPTTIKDLFVSRGAPVMTAVARGEQSDDLSVEVTAGDSVVLRLSGLDLTPVDDGHVTQEEPHAAARLEWLPDFDLINHATLFTPPRSIPEETQLQEEMTLLCIIETADRVRDLTPCNWHFEKFRSWLDLEIGRARNGTYPLLETYGKDYLDMPSEQRQAMIEERYKKLLTLSSKGAVAVGIKRIYDNCQAIFSGQADTLDTLMQGDILTEIYNAVSFGKGDFFKLLSHSKPNLRVLEVGAGTGGTTEMILRNLVRPDGLPAYGTYTFTDVSAGFFPQAQDRFSYAPNMDYRVFDISQSPFEQGFEAGTYDVILAPNVIHATPSLRETLGNLHPLLRTGGLLVLTELCAVVRTPNYIFGNFSGWWLGESDGRPNEPYVSVDRWDDELRNTGFSGVDTAVRDAQEPYHYCAAIVSTKLDENNNTAKAACGFPGVSVLVDDPVGVLSGTVVAELRKSGIEATVFQLGDNALPTDQDIISLLDVEAFFFAEIDSHRWTDFQQVLQRHASGSILWLTRPAQINCKDPRSAQTIGVARSIRAESRVPFHTLEIDAAEPDFARIVRQVLQKMQRSSDTELLAPDREYVVDKGVVNIGRYQPFLVKKEMREIGQISGDVVARQNFIKSLHTSHVGSLENLSWISDTASSLEIGDDEVVIETRAVGLNFKDVLYAMGVLKPDSNSIVPFGLEVAGEISRVGSAVSNLQVGDRVLAMPPSAAFKTVVTTPASLVQRIPRTLSFEDAATLPICYTTVIEGLVNLGQLESGQSVLIHSATGGIGHASIQICQSMGAEIYATVGTQEKANYLVDKFNIPRDHIFHSRDESFAAELKRATNGRGVDIVLNSLSGELLHASWDCVAEFGKLIEIGKKDIVEGGSLSMQNFLMNRSYCCVDMTHMAQKRPQRAGANDGNRLLKRCIDMYEAGSIGALSPVATFEAAAVQEAFGWVQDGNHIGKSVVRIPDDISTILSSPQDTKLQLKSDASYLLTGGLGGLGKVIATWLVEHGAKSLVFLSRSAGLKPEDQAFSRELETSGCSVVFAPGRAEAREDIEGAIALAPQPVRGVIHLAMVLRDSPIATMAHEDWLAANDPKVKGAWNLHECLEDVALDFFVMASSLVTVVEQPGQGNYSASNTFLEAFTQYRRSLGLPASVLNICPIDGVGFVAENSFARKNMKAQGLYFLRETELLDFLELSIQLSPVSATASSRSTSEVASNEAVTHFEIPEKLLYKSPWTSMSQMVMGLRSEGDLKNPNTRTNWRRDRRMGFYHNISDSDASRAASSAQKGSSELAKFLVDAVNNPSLLSEARSADFLAQEICRKVFSLMLKEEETIDTSMTLQQIGLDSLMAIELRRWWKLAFGLEISVLEILATGTLKALGMLAADGLKAKFTQVAE